MPLTTRAVRLYRASFGRIEDKRMGAVWIEKKAGELVPTRKRVRDQATISSHIRLTFGFPGPLCNTPDNVLNSKWHVLGGALIAICSDIAHCGRGDWGLG